MRDIKEFAKCYLWCCILVTIAAILSINLCCTSAPGLPFNKVEMKICFIILFDMCFNTYKALKVDKLYIRFDIEPIDFTLCFKVMTVKRNRLN